VELAKHPGPISVFVQLRKPLGKAGDPFENNDVALDHRFEIRTLYFYSNLFTRVQPSAIDLPERCCGDRLKLEFAVNFADLSSEFVFDDRKRNIVRKCRNLIDQGAKLFYKWQRQQIGSRAHRLANFYKRRPELDKLFLEPNGLLFLVLFPIFVATQDQR